MDITHWTISFLLHFRRLFTWTCMTASCTGMWKTGISLRGRDYTNKHNTIVRDNLGYVLLKWPWSGSSGAKITRIVMHRSRDQIGFISSFDVPWSCCWSRSWQRNTCKSVYFFCLFFEKQFQIEPFFFIIERSSDFSYYCTRCSLISFCPFKEWCGCNILPIQLLKMKNKTHFPQ